MSERTRAATGEQEVMADAGMPAMGAERSRRRAALRIAAGAAAFAALTALSAQPEVRLPFTPVPLTLQPVAVLLAGYFLGARGGFLSQATYLAAGAAGLPVFAGGGAGPVHLIGPTAGYLWAFPIAAFVVGAIAAGRRPGSLARALAAPAGLAVIHAGGAIGLGAYLLAMGQPLANLASLSLLPFLFPDLLKAALAVFLDAAIVSRLGGRGGT